MSFSPFESLRSLARRRGDDAALAPDAARALGMLDGDPAGLVVACRRVLGHHRTNGALWWVSAQLLSTDDIGLGARRSAGRLEDDHTSDLLRDALGLQDEGERLGVIGWPGAVAGALDERFDLEVVAVVDDDDRVAARAASDRAELVEAYEFADASVRIALLAPNAASPTRMLVPAVATDVLAEARALEMWVVLPLGRLLPERLLDAVVDANRTDEDYAVIDFERVARVIDFAAVDTVADLATRVDCPIPAELLRPLDP
jgi:hypothetical protein